jgi:hypothetical protein
MAPDALEGFVVLATILVGAACYRAWTAQTAHLNLSLFRPYRGDPWPIGVQEDDDFQFNWSHPGANLATEADAAAETLAGADDRGPADAMQFIAFEDSPRAMVAVERVDTITVRRGGR